LPDAVEGRKTLVLRWGGKTKNTQPGKGGKGEPHPHVPKDYALYLGSGRIPWCHGKKKKGEKKFPLFVLLSRSLKEKLIAVVDGKEGNFPPLWRQGEEGPDTARRAIRPSSPTG